MAVLAVCIFTAAGSQTPDAFMSASSPAKTNSQVICTTAAQANDDRQGAGRRRVGA
jgi:hypothetical protein